MRHPLFDYFPNLESSEWALTSEKSTLYNCIAWAAGDQSRWWQPRKLNSTSRANTFWPIDKCDWSIENLVQAFESLGYELSENGNFENEFEKVAIYVNGIDVPTHMARQLDEKFWTSKCGADQDISHTLESLTGSAYGAPKLFLKRKKHSM